MTNLSLTIEITDTSGDRCDELDTIKRELEP